jgi:hypothetical protein
MFGFKTAKRSKELAREKAYWDGIGDRHLANLEAERGPQVSQPLLPSRKKAGFGKRTTQRLAATF